MCYIVLFVIMDNYDGYYDDTHLDFYNDIFLFFLEDIRDNVSVL